MCADIKALSLFSGIGGIDLAAEAAGIKTVAFCEREPFCQKVLKKHWPNVPIFDDVFKLRGGDVNDKDNPIQLIHGGFPCQPFSVAGRQRGRDDERYLWPEFSRLIGEIKPLWVVAENVSGILRIAADDVCQDLERLGYSVGIWCYEAAAVGARHRRLRVFFVAHAKGGRSEPRIGERNRDSETYREKTNDPTSGSGEPSSILSDAGRRLLTRGAIARAFRGEPEKWPSPDAERSSSSPVPDTEGHGRREGDEIAGGSHEGNFPRAWDRPAFPRSVFPDADIDREPQQAGSVTEIGEWSGDRCKDVADANLQQREKQQRSVADQERFTGVECGGREGVEPRLGRVVDGIPGKMDGYWRVEPDIPRVAKGIANRVARLKALGNAVVPAQIYPIFRAIAEIERGE